SIPSQVGLADMPTFTESFPQLVSALDRHLGPPQRPGQGWSAFERLFACYWGRVISSKSLAAVLQGLDDLGWTSPEALADLELTEFQDTLLSLGLNVSAKALAPLLRLIRWSATHPELFEDEPDARGAWSPSAIRDEIAAIKGIGP